MGSLLQAQVIEWHQKNGTGKHYMISIDSIVYEPAQDWSIKLQVDSFYTDTEEKVHVVASATIGPDAHLALAAIGNNLTREHFANDSVETIRLEAGTTQVIDLVVPNPQERCKIYAVTKNNYNTWGNIGDYYMQSVEVDYPSYMENKDWKSLGKGKFADAFLGGAGQYSEVEIQQNKLKPNTFRVVEPYAEILGRTPDKYLEFFILPAGSEFSNFVTDAEYVIFYDYNTGQWNSNYAEDIYAIHPYRMGRAPYKWNYNVVLDYQENGLPGEVSLAPVYYLYNLGGGWDETNANTISILFPGYVKRDYSAEVHYTETIANEEGATFAVANLTLGADATEVKAIVMPQADDITAVADALAEGELEGTRVQAGRIEIPFNAKELGSEALQIIVAVIAEGKVKTTASTHFDYVNPKAWKSIGIGTYTESFVGPFFGMDPVTYEVEIQENTEKPGLYRVMNAYANGVYPYSNNDCAPKGSFLEINACDPNGVYIPMQSLGFDRGRGEISIVSEGARYLEENDFEIVKNAGYFGTLKDGVITLPSFNLGSGDNVSYYQGIIYMGDRSYYAGIQNGFSLTLPGAKGYAPHYARKLPLRNQVKVKEFKGLEIKPNLNKRIVKRNIKIATKF